MTDWLLIATRWALYADLGLLFGVPLFGLYALRGAERADLLQFRPLVAILAALGAVLSLFGFALLTAAMSGTELGGIDSSTATMLISETSVGWAFLVREGALVLAFLAAVLLPRRTRHLLSLATAFGAIAAGALAWAGHGAAGEGAAGMLQLVSDIAHVLAASAWLGALVVLALLLLAPDQEMGRVRTIHRALAGFATIGSILVGLIVITGIVNGAFVVGIANLWSLGASLYGQLLIVKLVLFAAMLGLAASNRFRLTPSLGTALEQGDPARATGILRRSLMVETILAIGILGLVAWFGTLEPPMSGR